MIKLKQLQATLLYLTAIAVVVVSIFPFIPQEITQPIKDLAEIKQAKAASWAPSYSVTVRDLNCSAQEGTSYTLAYSGSVAARDTNGKDIDCARINGGAYSPPTNPYESLFINDFRIGIQVAESESGCSASTGAIAWTPWATDGGGWSGITNGSGGMQAADCIRIHMETRPLPNRIAIRSVNMGISVGAGSMAYSGSFSNGGDFTSASLDLQATSIAIPDDARFVSTTVPTITAELQLNTPANNNNIVMQNKAGAWNTDVIYSQTGNCSNWTPTGPGQTCVENRVMTSDNYVLRRIDNNSARVSTNSNEFKYKENVTYTWTSVEELDVDCEWIPDDPDNPGNPPLNTYENSNPFIKKAYASYPVPGDGGHEECTETPTGNYLAAGPSMSSDPTIQYDQNATFDSVNVTGLVSGDTVLMFQMYNVSSAASFGEVATLNVRVAGAPLNPDFMCGTDLTKSASSLPGSTASYGVWATPVDGFNSSINVVLMNAPANVVPVISPVVLVDPSYADNFEISTAGATAGTYTITFRFRNTTLNITKFCDAQLIITAPPPPTPTPDPVVDIKCDGQENCNIAYNGTVNVSWTSSGAFACNIYSSPAGFGPRFELNHGGVSSQALTQDTDFNIECNSYFGGPQVVDVANVTVGSAPTPTPSPPQVDIVCDGSDDCQTNSGGIVNLSWNSSFTTSCSVSSNRPGYSGGSGTSGSNNSQPITVDPTSFTVNCTGPGGNTSDTATVTLLPPVPQVDIVCDGSDDCDTTSGSTVVLWWAATNATACSVVSDQSGYSGGSGTSGSNNSQPIIVNPTRFTVNCTGPGGNTSDTATAHLVAVPTPEPVPNVDILCEGSDDCMTSMGLTVNISWQAYNATSCTVTSNRLGYGTYSGLSGNNNSQPIIVDPTTFTANCSGPGGNAFDTTTVTLLAVPSPTPPSVDIKCEGQDNCNAFVGSSVSVSWSSVHANTCTVFSDQPGFTPQNGVSGSTVSQTLTNNPTRFTADCQGDGGQALDVVQVNLQPTPTPPVVDLRCQGDNPGYTDGPCNVTYNTTGYLEWSSTDASTCSISSSDNSLNGPVVTNLSNYATGNLISDISVTITCSGAGGTDADTVNFVVGTPLSVDMECATTNSNSFSNGPCTIEYGTSARLRWNSTAATGDSCRLYTPIGWNNFMPADYGPADTVLMYDNHTYIVRCYFTPAQTGSYVEDAVEVVVNPQAPPTMQTDISCSNSINGSYSGGPCTVIAGNSGGIQWDSSTVSGCELLTPTGWTMGHPDDQGPRATDILNNNHTYQLKCFNDPGHTGPFIQVSVSFVVLQPPVVDIVCDGMDACSTVSGSTVDVGWQSYNTDDCSVTSNNFGILYNGVSGGFFSPPVTIDQTNFTSDCSGPGGSTSDTATVTLVVTPTPTPLPVVDIICDGLDICDTTSGSTVAISWTSANTSACNITSDASGFGIQTGTSGTTNSQPIVINPTRFTANCSGPGGNTSDTAIVNIVTVLNPDFTMDCSPATQSVQQGQQVTYTIDTTAFDGFNSAVAFTSSYVNTSPASPPNIDINPTSHIPSGTSIVTITTLTSTSLGNYTISFTGTGGTLTRTCQVDLDIVPSSPPGQPSSSAAVANCGEVMVTWSAGAGLSPDFFRVDRSDQPTGPWDPTQQIGVDYPYTGSGPYSYLDTTANTTVSNYYAVIAYRAGVPSTPGTTPGIIAQSCSPNLSGSDKDITAIAGSGSVGIPLPNSCNGQHEEFIHPSLTLYKPGQTVDFTICVSNSGNAPFVNGQVLDTPDNLVNISPALFSNIGGVPCGWTISPTQFGLVDMPSGTSCLITFSADITVPANPGTIESFANTAYIFGQDMSGNPFDVTVFTRPYNFSASSTPPKRNETAP